MVSIISIRYACSLQRASLLKSADPTITMTIINFDCLASANGGDKNGRLHLCMNDANISRVKDHPINDATCWYSLYSGRLENKQDTGSRIGSKIHQPESGRHTSKGNRTCHLQFYFRGRGESLLLSNGP